MADYFLMLDAAAFEGRARPVLAASWRLRSFEPCRSFCTDLLPSASAYAEQYHVGADEPLLRRVADGLPFHRAACAPSSAKYCCLRPWKFLNFKRARRRFAACSPRRMTVRPPLNASVWRLSNRLIVGRAT